MSHVKLEIIQRDDNWVIIEGTSEDANGAIVGRYNCKTGIIETEFHGSRGQQHYASHIVKKMLQYLEMKDYHVRKVKNA